MTISHVIYCTSEIVSVTITAFTVNVFYVVSDCL